MIHNNQVVIQIFKKNRDTSIGSDLAPALKTTWLYQWLRIVDTDNFDSPKKI